VWVGFLLLISIVQPVHSATSKVLHAFNAYREGLYPNNGLVVDAAGNIYGRTSNGGVNGESYGVMFKLAPKAGGKYAESVIHNFTSSEGVDWHATVIGDAAGNLYGASLIGGPNNAGSIFEISPDGQGGYTETIIFNFSGVAYEPQGGLVLDKSGNLYGTTLVGGTYGYGAAFKLSPTGSGWNLTVLHNFTGTANDALPDGSFTLDDSGNLYGVCTYGGTSLNGIVFELSPSVGGEWTNTTLYSFAGGADGARPHDALVWDAAGNLYGTTGEGGGSTACLDGCGTVYRLRPISGGQWTEDVVYSFQGESDGAGPLYGVIFDKSGNLYGTTPNGGSGNCEDGCGTVFQLTPVARGPWTEHVLWKFTNGSDGAFPTSALILSAGRLIGETGSAVNLWSNNQNGTVFNLSPTTGGEWTLDNAFTFQNTDGNYPMSSLVAGAEGGLYGTTSNGGQHGLGMVYKLTRSSGGEWKESNIYSFTTGSPQMRNGLPGATYPSPMIFDEHGNLYGETLFGGSEGGGMVFELSPLGEKWEEKALFNFRGLAGSNPIGGLVRDSAGNVYGVTQFGGKNNEGLIFELSPDQSGHWKETILHDFAGYPTDAGHPEGGLALDGAGNLYGTSREGGNGTCEDRVPPKVGCRTVFELSPSTGGWTERLLHQFGKSDFEGRFPAAGLVFDLSGNLYGTTQNGGDPQCGCGTIFELIPGVGGGWSYSVLHSFGVSEGANPEAALIADEAGNLYGTTTSSPGLGYGTVFELSPTQDGNWTLNQLYQFSGNDGGASNASLLLGPDNNLVGTTFYGGTPNQGVVFRIIR
jgi:uncharacterized repeat protein (TIGR03803 family)